MECPGATRICHLPPSTSSELDLLFTSHPNATAAEPQEPTLRDMGPDGLYDLQSNSFGTNGQSLLVLTHDNEYSLHLRPVVEFLFGANSNLEAQSVVTSLDSQSHTSQLSILNLQPYLSSPTQPYLSLASTALPVSHPECVDSIK